MSNGAQLPIPVRAMGMSSALGPSAVAACAAGRAGIARARSLQHEVFASAEGEMVPTSGCFAGVCEPGFAGPGRVAELARNALLDLERHVHDGALHDADTAACIVLSDHDHESVCIDAETRDLGSYRDAVLAMRMECLREVMEREVRSVDREVTATLARLGATDRGRHWFRGRAAFAAAAQTALAMLRERRAAACVLGAFDSLLDSETLDALHALDLLKGPDNPVGVIPGEAGVALLLCAVDTAPTSGALAMLDSVAIDAAGATEPDPFVGGPRLAKVVRACLPSPTPGVRLLADLNGDERRAAEWGHASITAGWPAQATTVFPATAFGETGSAAGAVAAALAIHGLSRGVHASDCVVTISELRGPKAALRFTAGRG